MEMPRSSCPTFNKSTCVQLKSGSTAYPWTLLAFRAQKSSCLLLLPCCKHCMYTHTHRWRHQILLMVKVSSTSQDFMQDFWFWASLLPSVVMNCQQHKCNSKQESCLWVVQLLRLIVSIIICTWTRLLWHTFTDTTNIHDPLLSWKFEIFNSTAGCAFALL